MVCWSEGRFAPMEKTARNSRPALSQIHVRLPSELKRIVKMYCAQEGVTEQAWLLDLIKAEMEEKAPNLWRQQKPSSARITRESASTRRTRRTR
jgi:hypothetical protein